MSVTLLIEPLREGFPQRVCGKFAVQPCCDKHIIEYFMNRLALNGGVAFAGRKQRDIGMYAPEVGAVPRDNFSNRLASIGIHWDRPTRFSALDDRSVKLEIGDGLVRSAIDIADGESEQFTHSPSDRHTEHKQSAIPLCECAFKRITDFADFFVG